MPVTFSQSCRWYLQTACLTACNRNILNAQWYKTEKANPPTWEAGTNKCLAFLSDKWQSEEEHDGGNVSARERLFDKAFRPTTNSYYRLIAWVIKCQKIVQMPAFSFQLTSSKPQRYLVSYHGRPREASDPRIWEAGHFCFKMIWND